MKAPYPDHPVDRSLVESSLGQVVYQDPDHTITTSDVFGVLLAGGLAVYISGGAPRDWLCGRKSKDLDVYVDRDLDTVRKLLREAFPDLDLVAFSLESFGFLRWGGDGDGALDISILRSYRDIRNQQMWTTRFPARSDLVEDALMRDFSVNAFYYDLTDHKLLDPLSCGLDDLRRKRLRLIAHPAVLASSYRTSLRIIQFLCRGYELAAVTSQYLRRSADRDVEGMGEKRLRYFFKTNVVGKGFDPNEFRSRLAPWLREDAARRLLDQVTAESLTEGDGAENPTPQ